MRVALLTALLATGCRIDLDEASVKRQCLPSELPVCIEAESHSDFEWLSANIFTSNCSGESCHGHVEDGIPDGKLVLSGDLDPATDPDGALSAFRTLMGADRNGVISDVDDTRKLVVPGNAEASYLFFIMRGVFAAQGEPPFTPPPDDIGYMPRRAKILCCQKLEAVGRWIEAGALPPTSM